MGRQVERVSVWPAVLVGLLLVCGAGALVSWEMKWRQFREADKAGEAWAEAELDQRVRRYADTVIADGETAPADEHLVAVGQQMEVSVREIRRVPSLTVAVHGYQAYSPWPGSVSRCDQITFLDLGQPSATARIETLPACPAATGLPTPPGSGP